MKTISRDELKRKMDQNGLAVVDVLESEEYQKFHLPRAVNVPLTENFDHEIQEAVPDKEKPVVVYCMSKQCTASHHAAEIMDKLGYKNVLAYEAGKTDWKEAGLPVEM